jgi:hypothetical protein
LSDHDVADPSPATPAALVARLDAEVQRRLADLPEAQRGGFVSSELSVVHAALRSVLDRDLARGRVFCEWGSGLGAVCAVAASLDFAAHGIEIEASLVDGARELVAGLGLDAAFAHGSFLGPGDADLIAGSGHIRTDATADAYGALGLTPAACDVVFAYPWPGEEELYDRLFARHATRGALLLTHHECSRLLVQRRTGDAGELQSLGWVGAPGA